jgi:hypothetical protein
MSLTKYPSLLCASTISPVRLLPSAALWKEKLLGLLDRLIETLALPDLDFTIILGLELSFFSDWAVCLTFVLGRKTLREDILHIYRFSSYSGMIAFKGAQSSHGPQIDRCFDSVV